MENFLLLNRIFFLLIIFLLLTRIILPLDSDLITQKIINTTFTDKKQFYQKVNHYISLDRGKKDNYRNVALKLKDVTPLDDGIHTWNAKYIFLAPLDSQDVMKEDFSAYLSKITINLGNKNYYEVQRYLNLINTLYPDFSYTKDSFELISEINSAYKQNDFDNFEVLLTKYIDFVANNYYKIYLSTEEMLATSSRILEYQYSID